MTTSGTYDYNPGLGEITLYAYNIAGVRSTALTQAHFEAARMAANMICARWSGAQGVNLWAVDLQTIPLVQGQATYSIPANTITMLDAYVVTGSGSTAINRLILPISRTEYASYTNPEQQGFPSVFWFDRLLSPTVTLYFTPDGNETSLNYYRVRQIQDANFTNGQTVELPIYFLEAFAFALAARLAIIWAPEKAVALKAMADESYEIAITQNVEASDFYISPIVAGYWR